MELVSETLIMGQGKAAWAESAFERVFLEHYRPIVGVLFRMLGDRARAEELASDTFLRLYQQPLEQEQYSNLGGWLYRTATRIGIDAMRAVKRRTHYEREAAVDTTRSAANDDPLDDVLRAERQRQVQAALARMKPQQAQLLALRSSGLSYLELAAALKIKSTGVGRALARAEEAFEKAWRRANGSALRGKENCDVRF